MKNLIILLVAVFSFGSLYAQVNPKDSTVTIKANWKLNKTRSYFYRGSYYSVNGTDTTLEVGTKYIFNITVVDSSADGYKIKWDMKLNDIIGDPNYVSSIKNYVEDQILYVKTNTEGVFEEIVNWTDYRDYSLRLFKGRSKLDENDPKAAELIAQFLESCNTHNKVVNNVNQELRQYYFYHGGVCKWGNPIEYKLESYPYNETDMVESTMYLNVDEINIRQGYSTISSKISDNRPQLTDAFYNYLKNAGADLSAYPTRESFPECISDRNFTASIEHDTGWILSSIEYNVNSRGGETKLEKKTFQQIK